MRWQLRAWTARMMLLCRHLDWHPAALTIGLEHLGGSVRMAKLQVRWWYLRTILLGAPYHNRTPLHTLGHTCVVYTSEHDQRDLIDVILEFVIP